MGTTTKERYLTGPERSAKLIATLNIPPRQAAEIRGMLDLHEIARGPALKPIGLWLVDQVRPTWPRWAGLKAFSRTSDRSRFIILSLHHPAQLCWQWSLSITFGRRAGGWTSPRRWFGSAKVGQIWLSVPYLFCIRYSRQSYDCMLSQEAKWRLEAMAMPRGSFSLEAWAGE